MKHSYLEVTYRKGRLLAAYYYLPRREGDRSARTDRIADGFVVDLTADGRAIGVEIVTPARFVLAKLNDVLARYGQPLIRPEDVAPLAAA
ncbi:MAG: DUF2283 domain-containing protein [Planctomycetota bacterium]